MEVLSFLLAFVTVVISCGGICGLFLSLPMAEKKWFLPVTFGFSTAPFLGILAMLIFKRSPFYFIPLALAAALYVPFFATVAYNLLKGAQESFAEEEKEEPFRDAIVEERRRDYQGAIKLYEEFLKDNGRNCEALKHLISCLTIVGRNADAINACRRLAAAEKGPRQVAAVVHLVRRLRAEKGAQAAQKEIEKWRETYYNTPLELEFEDRLKTM